MHGADAALAVHVSFHDLVAAEEGKAFGSAGLVDIQEDSVSACFIWGIGLLNLDNNEVVLLFFFPLDFISGLVRLYDPITKPSVIVCLGETQARIYVYPG